MTDQLSDAILLERFVTSHEEAAFALLVQRHGPRVLRACRRILPNEHDAEEVSQATFLVLARKAGELPWRESIAAWLCAVAHRLSLNARAGLLRRCRHEVPAAALAVGSGVGSDSASTLPDESDPDADPLAEIARRELRRVLDEELSCLPEKYRAPMVLCYLEGMTNEEAARELGWPSGSMSRRLERARTILRQRLASRGMWIGLFVCFTLAVSLKGWQPWSTPHAGSELGMVRTAMAPFKATREGGEDLERLLGQLVRADQPSPSMANALLLAQRSARAAERLEGYDPGYGRAVWIESTVAMRRSALAMSEAAEQGDASAVVDAARQLNRRCYQCHVAFRH